MSKSNSNFFLPSEDELCLINAAISNDSEKALVSLKTWIRNHNFKVDALSKSQVLPHIYDQLELGSKRLLPLVYSNFRSHQIDHPVVNQFAGYHRYTIFRNRMLQNELEIIIEQLQKKEIPYFVRKGIVYSSLFYKDYGARPTSDIDIVIKKEDVEEFLIEREKEGWDSIVNWRLNPIQDSIAHATTLRKEHFELDLHWRFGHHPIPEKWNNYLLNHLVSFDGFKTIPTELHLIDTLVHGYRFNVVRPIRWVCDAHKIAGSGISNWDLIIEYSKDCLVSLPVKYGLSYLKDRGFADIPDDVLKQLEAIPSNPKMNKYYKIISSTDNNVYNIIRYSISTSNNRWSAMINVLKHYRLSWNQKNYFYLIFNMLLILFERIFLKKKVFLKKVRHADS